MRVLSAALDLAAQNIPVFPCAVSKCPTTPEGYKNASTDPDEIRRLWCNHPGDLIGMPTGAVSGFDVLDIDQKHEAARDWWCHNRQRTPQTRVHRTRSGGLHLVFAHNNVMRCSAGKIARGVDTRGAGGYMIWWPATGLPVLSEAPPALWPDWLLGPFRGKPPVTPRRATIISGDGWLRGLVRIVADTPEGERNQVLFWASCRAGEAVRRGYATESFVTDVLIEAAARAGLPAREAQRTIQSNRHG